MTSLLCTREDELLDALTRGCIGPELAAHVEVCAACRELRQIAGALLDDRREAMISAPVPSSGTMLWRMQLRQRLEAETTARRSLMIGQAVTLTVALILVASLLGVQFAGGVREVIATLRLTTPLLGTPLLLALAVSLLAAPVAGWAAIRQK